MKEHLKVRYSGKESLNLAGVASMSVPELSYHLTLKGKHHHIELRKPKLRRGCEDAKIKITDSLGLAEAGKLNLIVGTPGFFELTNVKVMSIDLALKNKELLVPIEYELCLLSLVDIVAKPSLLSDMLTAASKISPYSLRKESHEAVVKYLTGKLSKRATVAVLSQAPSQLGLLKSLPGIAFYREAFQELKKLPAEKVAAKYSVPKFDLNYLWSLHVSKGNTKAS